ncbi:MAG: PD-(D/E)XK nuclease domain-containing protein, partial [Tannerella sp.]|nr:PD-(D/E)XK nuclease domain-containing protein [Tannerella sp.]
QIDDKGYLIPFTASNKRLVKIGAEFSEKERGLNRWVIE